MRRERRRKEREGGSVPCYNLTIDDDGMEWYA